MRMVQRKLVDKLGIQANHVKSKKGSSPSPDQDNNNKGAADLKQTMEKSRNIQHSDIASLRSTPSLRSRDIHNLTPGKLPTCHHVKTRAATPQRQYPEGSPNYMKSTSSFDARKEGSQVSSQTPQNVMKRKSMIPVKSKNSRHNSGTDHKLVGAVARTSSFKIVRTLTKTPTFKPARPSTKQYSPIALVEDFDVQKPTCSSTLKDSKMPIYLELSAGATESAGTSALKVCPYTYCSLNGHYHAPLPPLKSFLSTKRRMLKAQKVIKLGCLSSRRIKPSRERMVEKEAKQVILAEKPPTNEMDFDSRPVMPVKQTVFFVEIYSNNKDEKEKTSVKEILEAEKYQNVEARAKIHPFPETQEGEINYSLSTRCKREEEIQQISQYGQLESEASKMKLKEGNHYEPSLNDVSDLKLKVTDFYNGSKIGSISDTDDDTNNSYANSLKDEVQVGFYDEKSVSSGAWSDDGDSDLDGSYNRLDLEKQCIVCNKQIHGKIYSTCDGHHESAETQVRENTISHPIEELEATNVEKSEVPEASTGEKDQNYESIETRVKENSIAHPMEEFQATSVEKIKVPEASHKVPKLNFQLEFDAIKCKSDLEEVVFGLQGDEAAKKEHVGWLLYQDFTEHDQDETCMNYNASLSSTEVFVLDSTSENRSSNDVLNESLLAKTECEDADQEDHKEKISTTDVRDEMEEKEPLAVKPNDGIRSSDSLRDNECKKPIADAREGMERKEKLLAALHFVKSQPFQLLPELPDKNAVNKDQSKQTDVTIVSETNQSYADESVAYKSNGVENHEYLETNQDHLWTYEFKSFKNFEDQMHSGLADLKATPIQNQEADTSKGENRTEPDAAETSIIAEASAIKQKRDHMSNANRMSNKEMAQVGKHISWITGSRKGVAELEDSRDFNPREPNYLPAQPDVEPEKVDLRHQLMDERKNSEEWMVDYALRQVVTNLAPKRRRKVSLLVEAFEKVLPTPKYETRPSHTSSAFIHARTIQTCR